MNCGSGGALGRGSCKVDVWTFLDFGGGFESALSARLLYSLYSLCLLSRCTWTQRLSQRRKWTAMYGGQRRRPQVDLSVVSHAFPKWVPKHEY